MSCSEHWLCDLDVGVDEWSYNWLRAWEWSVTTLLETKVANDPSGVVDGAIDLGMAWNGPVRMHGIVRLVVVMTRALHFVCMLYG